MTDEKPVWADRPSQMSQLGFYLACLIFSPLLIPAFFGIARWLDLRCTRYELSTQRLMYHHGVLTRRHDPIELFRVKDCSCEKTLWQRFFSLSTLTLISSDATHPKFKIQHVRQGQKLEKVIRELVKTRREELGVRELDTH